MFMNKRRLVILPIALLSVGFLSSCSDDGISSRFDDLQSQIDEIKTEIVNLQTQISSLRHDMMEANSAIRTEYDGKISDINEQITSLENQLDELDKQYQEDKEALTNDYTSQVNDLKDYIDGKISELNDAISELNQQLTQLSEKHDADIQALSDDYSQKIAALSEADLEARKALEDDYNSKIDALNQAFTEAQTSLQNQITTNKNAIETFASNYLTEKAALELDYNTKISNLTTTYQAKVAEIEGSIATCNSNITTLQTEMNAALLANQNDYNSKINSLTNRVAALEAETYHTVTFDSALGSHVEDQIIKHGEKVTMPVDPTRPGFTFEGWTYNGNPWVFYGYVVTEDMTLTANWEYIDYTVTFKNDDGTVLETQTPVHYGDSVTYHGDIPIKPNPVDHYIYIFNGWDVDITNITGDTIAVAQYTAEYAPFTANFYDEEDNLLYSTFVKEGETASYVGETPTKADDNVNKLQFQFSGWDEISRTSDTVNYKVHFQSCTKGLVFEGNSVYQYIGSATTVIIPSYWGETAITNISRDSFTATNIEEIIVSDGILTIDDAAFVDCTELETVVLPNTIVSVGDVSEVHVESDGFIVNRTKGVFYNCSSLTTINIPTSLNYIAVSCFCNCSSLDNIIIHNGIEIIGDRAFEGCSSLKTIDVPNSVVSLGKNAFSLCSSLESFVLPSAIRKISGGLFSGCSLTSFTIPYGVETIGEVAFAGCRSLKTISIPDTVKIIGEQAFSSCSSLETVFLSTNPDTIIEWGAFNYCPSLTIFVSNAFKPKAWSANWHCNNPVVWGFESLIEVDGYRYSLSIVDDEKRAYLINAVDEIVNFEAPSVINGYTLFGINMRIFKENTTVKSVVIPDCVDSIPDQCFLNCAFLKTVSLPDTILSIGNEAFNSCFSLETINIPNGVASIGTCAFGQCSSLASIEIPESVLSIGEEAFIDCSSLVSISLNSSLTATSINMFCRCEGLQSFRIPDNIKTIAKYSFDSCIRLTNIDFGNGVESIEQSAFDNCYSLQYIVVPQSLSSVNNYAFYRCSSLGKVFYKGTEDQWSQISISFGNDQLSSATKYYLSELEPANPGNYWHYVEGVPTIW